MTIDISPVLNVFNAFRAVVSSDADAVKLTELHLTQSPKKTPIVIKTTASRAATTDFFTPAQLAQELGIPYHQAMYLIVGRKIASARVNNRYRLSRADIDA